MKNPSFTEKTRVTVIGTNGVPMHEYCEIPTNPFNQPDCISLWSPGGNLVVIPMSRVSEIRFSNVAPGS